METEETSLPTKEILLRLAKLQNDMQYIKEHIEDVALSEDDFSSIKEAKKNLKEGKTKRL